MAQIGIICNAYKVDTYQKELKKFGYDKFETTKHQGDLWLIKIETELRNQEHIGLICQDLETKFASKKK